MGNSSSTLPEEAKTDFTWNPTKERTGISIGSFNNPFLLSEKNISYFHDPNLLTFTRNNKHKAGDLAQLVLGCYEQLENIDEILETIIEADTEPESDVIKYLSHCFSNYSKSANDRLKLFLFNSQFCKKFYSPFEMLSMSPMDGIKQPSFSLLMTALSTSLSLLNDPKFPFQSLYSFVDFFNGSYTSTSLPPPTPEFLPSSQIIHEEMFTTSYVNPHGTSSNGQFLFVLCADNILQIFPLLNGGTISSLITVDLSFLKIEIPQNASLRASEQHIQIYFTINRTNASIELDIYSLIQNTQTMPVISSTPYNYQCSCSDGIVHVVIYPDHTFKAFDIRKKTVISHCELSKRANLPLDLSTQIIETNGVFLGILQPLENHEASYKVFSIKTGNFLNEERFPFPDQIVSSTIDSINKCHWSVIFAGNSRFCVRRYAFRGGENPKIFDIETFSYPIPQVATSFSYLPILVSSLHRHMYGLINSQIAPFIFLAQKADEFFKLVDLLDQILNYPEDKAHLLQSCHFAAKQCLAILISLNLKRIECTSEPTDFICSRVLKIIRQLPTNLAALLFFSNFDYLTFNQSDDSIMLLLGIIKSINNDVLLSFVLRMMEESLSIGKIPFTMRSGLLDIIPQDLKPASSIEPSMLSFILLHQRCLVRKAEQFLKNDPLAVIQFTDRTPENTTPLDLLADYIQLIIPKFDAALGTEAYETITSSLIYFLFTNFISLLSSLVDYHSVAQIVTALLTLLIGKLANLVKYDDKTVLYIIFIFGKFASTLLMGGGMSEFESKFLWLIRSNINLIDKPEVMKILHSEDTTNMPDERINLFINNQGNSIEFLYKKCKPHFNRNLSDEFKQIDRIALAAFAKHIDCLDEMLFYDGTRPPSSKLKGAFDQMLRVRNEYRSYHQANKDTSVLKRKCLMLLRMESDKQIHQKSLGDFVISNFAPSYVTKIIKSQRKRIQTTLVGFALLDRTYGMNVESLFNHIIGYNLSQIKSFEGLSSIMRITHLSDAQVTQVHIFFQRIIETVSSTGSNLLVMVAFRFFRDLDSLQTIQSSFLDSVLSLYESMPLKYSLFALSLLLARNSIMVPAHLLNMESNSKNAFRWLILAESLKTAIPPEDFIGNFINRVLWSSPPETMRLILRILYNIQNKIGDPQNILLSMIQVIGDQIKVFRNLSLASELILFLRRIIVNVNAPWNGVLINLILNSNMQNSNESVIIGIFAILGFTIENIRPYALMRMHTSRNELKEFYVIPKIETKKLVFYSRPFHLDSEKAIDMSINPSSYAVPLIEIQPDQFPYFDYILSFFIFCNDSFYTSTTIFALYMQVFASFCKSNNFVQLISPEFFLKLYENPLPFHDIVDTIRSLESLCSTRIIPESNVFDILAFDGLSYKTLLSPPIFPNAPDFETIISLPPLKSKFNTYIGIVSDNLEPTFTRYILIEFPTGNVYPMANHHVKFGSLSSCIKLKINVFNRHFTINDNHFDFPPGMQFRIIVATNLEDISEVGIQTHPDNQIFDINSIPLIQSFDDSDESKLYNMPGWTSKTAKNLPFDFTKISKVSNIITPYSNREKFQNCFTIPPSKIIIHGLVANQATPGILQSLYRGHFKKLGLQYTSIALLRITSFQPDFVKPVVFQLFKHCIVALEPFSSSLFSNGMFPFPMDAPIWQTEVSPIYMSLENEAKKVLTVIVSDENNIKAIAFEIWKMSNSKKLHSLMLPQQALEFYPRAPLHLIVPRDMTKIFIFNNFSYFNGSWGETASIRNVPLNLPIFFSRKPQPTEIVFNEKGKQNSLSGLIINPMNNSWVINTPIELLLLLKNFTFIALQEHRPMIKSIILDSFICQSPLMVCYLNNFTDFIQLNVPSTPLDNDPLYMCRLALLGGFLNTLREPNFINFYQSEQRLLTSKIAAELSAHFPEFFSSPLPPANTVMCTIPAAIVDPGALNVDFTSHILTLRLFSKRYTSLHGFPFWELLPYWIRLSGFSSSGGDFIQPTVDRISSEVLRVSNPSIPRLTVKFIHRNRIPNDSILMYSESSLFEDAEYVDFHHFDNPIIVRQGETYFSLIGTGHRNPWEECSLQLIQPNMQEIDSMKPTEININKIRQKFIKDMTEFAIEWQESDTNELLSLIPRTALVKAQFADVESIARGSSLTTRYNVNVVVLRALLLHHYNYIRYHKYSSVPVGLWSSFTSFLSLDDASEALLSDLACMPYVKGQGIRFEINRHISRQLILAGKGNPKLSIISQLSKVISKYGAAKFRVKEKPWIVVFKGELAIDAGGPSRELVVEATSSIFEPTTDLMVPTDSEIDAHHHYYVPNEKATNRLNEFYAIGVLIGIIIRTGLLQDIPFAPFVWKAIAGERITDSDILEADALFRDSFKSQTFAQHRWTVDTWDGRTVILPGRIDADVPPEQLAQYQRECLSYRIQSIKPMLKQMRKGFTDSIGFKKHSMLKGPLLSRLAQGSGTITIEQLMAITRTSGFEDGKRNPFIMRFWKAVSRFNDEQRKLLFKFITTLTRMPNSARMGDDFHMTIDPLSCENPDIMLPTASTCFNRLHLPLYTDDEVAYQKILYAVQFCQTMENK
ncbi:hypothetical protein TRFO_36445 [Tritrichomonas foetus]|uniref:HECT domain-containing protein n=1 Tax=Tritrichomonas foetus TaxID=1144522 RepID=A0A1J4JDS7_9EUKA|nr:hypothetical protein TRFO_36445 [Tritrichomonas foetus]|eukprot:OHS97350.1 hypothetical protein TRFO_36445 [Tritrichomonas foetus]